MEPLHVRHWRSYGVGTFTISRRWSTKRSSLTNERNVFVNFRWHQVIHTFTFNQRAVSLCRRFIDRTLLTGRYSRKHSKEHFSKGVVKWGDWKGDCILVNHRCLVGRIPTSLAWESVEILDSRGIDYGTRRDTWGSHTLGFRKL